MISNPSAKFDPGGTAGFINVLLKKQHQSVISGLGSIKGGLDDKQGIDVLLTRKLNGLTLLLGANVDDNKFPGSEESERRTTLDGVTTIS